MGERAVKCKHGRFEFQIIWCRDEMMNSERQRGIVLQQCLPRMRIAREIITYKDNAYNHSLLWLRNFDNHFQLPRGSILKTPILCRTDSRNNVTFFDHEYSYELQKLERHAYLNQDYILAFYSLVPLLELFSIPRVF